jgi:transposase
VNHYTTVIGLDVHKDTIVTAVLPANSDRPAETSKLENRPEVVEKFVRRVSLKGPVEFVYEAGPCGYQTHRQITTLGHRCAVIAPGLTPVRPGDRVKTDRRDAEKLARLYRAGELTEIWVPTHEQEAARDLVRVREDILSDRLRARHRLSKFLLRQGRVYRETKSWGVRHWVWVRSQRFEWEPLERSFEAYVRAVQEVQERLAVANQQLEDLAQTEAYRVPVQYLRCLKGIDTLSALTLAVEAQEFRRFRKARSFIGYTGATSSEWSSAKKTRRGPITKVGNAHIRRVLVEASWSYRRKNTTSAALMARRKGCPEEVVRIARKAQSRLHRKFWRLQSKGKRTQIVAVAVARELAGFVWSISRHFPEPATS